MANIQTFDRAATCGACGETRARHIWGPEQASMAGTGCDGWTAGDEGAAPAAPSTEATEAEARADIRRQADWAQVFGSPEQANLLRRIANEGVAYAS